MKVAVIGRGSGGLITAMNLLTFNIDVDVYYDPETSQLPVGESTTPQFASLIECTLGLTIDDLISLGLASRKKGIEFVDWGNSKHFYHRFLHADAIHFYTKTLNPFLQENLEKYCNVKFIGKRVTALQALQNEYDFVINCSGALNNHRKEIDIPCVNSVLYFDDHKIHGHPEYTYHLAHEYGWKFSLPFPDKGLSRTGYLYNRKYQKHADAEILYSHGDLYEWVPSYAPDMIVGNRLALNGNALLFFEPLQALSLLHYDMVAKRICDYIVNGQTSEEKLLGNLWYRRMVEAYIDALAFHYQYGSKYDSEYWQEVSEKSVTRVGHKWWNDGMLIHAVRSSWGEGRNSHLTKHPDYYYAPDHTGIFGITCMYQLHEGLSGSTHR